MQRIRLNIHGEGLIEVHGTPDARRVIIVLSRENFARDEELIARLIAHFAGRDATVMRYESRKVETTRLISHPAFERLPGPLPRLMRAVRLLGHPGRWRHFLPRYRVEADSISHRAQALRELIAGIGPGREVFLLARSASARVATLVADEVPVNRVICLGYPFRHPEKDPEPDRYEHLARVRAPVLILQGNRDEYGGREIEGKYALGPQMRIEWLETDHGFGLSGAEWERMLGLMEAFLFDGTASGQGARAGPLGGGSISTAAG